MKIIDTNHPDYLGYWAGKPNKRGRFNGAYFYSKEIVDNMIPLLKTNRDIDTLGMRMIGSYDHALVFVHHCVNWDRAYDWIDNYDDQIYIVSTKPSYDWFVAKGKKTILLPLSVDVDFVSQFRERKTKGACYAGNRWTFKREDEDKNIPSYVEFPPANLPREDLLRFIAQYRELYAIGRCAIEGLILGCEIKPFYRVYPDPLYWKILDNKDAARILQRAIDMIEDGEDSVDCFEF